MPRKYFGWVKLWRNEIETAFFQQKPYDEWHAWKWIEMSASVSDGAYSKKGELITSIPKMMKEFGWTKGKVAKFLIKLEELGFAFVYTDKNRPKNGTKISLISSRKQAKKDEKKSINEMENETNIRNIYLSDIYISEKEKADADFPLNGESAPQEEDDDESYSWGVEL